jgi:Ni,Fe-hydrogenase III small subunit/formate hydrogenlyase subunit 6/NADH:ubiquinone oxidoreductase subunit I
MLKRLLQTFTNKSSTRSLQDNYPNTKTLDEGLFGVPRLRFEQCSSCGACANACPTNALTLQSVQDNTILQSKSEAVAQKLSLQLGSCVFCGRCQTACGDNAIQEEKSVEVAVTQRGNLLQEGFFAPTEGALATNPKEVASLGLMIERVNLAIFGIFSRSLQLYIASAGSCGGCEEELAAALGPFYQGTKIGVSITKNPLQADAFFVTGPIPRPLIEVLQRAYHAASAPKIVLSVGACACDGNVFRGSYAVLGTADQALPVDVYIPGCPPTPKNLLHGILLAMERSQEKLIRTEYLAPGLPQSLLTSLRQKPATKPMPDKHKESEERLTPPKETPLALLSPSDHIVEVAPPITPQASEPRASQPIDPSELP